jgi:hypothetical protein
MRVARRAGDKRRPDDLSRVVDAIGQGVIGWAGHVDLGEARAGVDETMVARAVEKFPTIYPELLVPSA